MKLSSAKPMSSPSRADKLPTPLMIRFLRSNVGSRSRGRSRSSPMFIMRTKKNAAVINNDAQQEPSSPKVTCIGQVRARRSSKSKRTSGRSNNPPKKLPPHLPCSCSCSYSCCCVPRTHFCCRFPPGFCKPKSFCRPVCKWIMFFRFGYCKKIDVRDDCSSPSSKVESIQRGQNHVNSASSNDGDIQDNQANGRKTKEDFLESSTSPPKNALLLTRCRSAPYRSSSLAGRFWGSPLGTSDNAHIDKSSKNEVLAMPISSNNSGNEAAESRNSSSHGESGNAELDSSSNGGRTNEATSNIQDLRASGIVGGGGGPPIHPLLLTRCKSEPARTGERLNPEVNYWRERRSDTTESCLQETSSNCD